MPALHKAIAQLMEGRQERPPQSADPAGLAALLAAVAERVPAEERGLAEAFARELLVKAGAALLGASDPAALAAMTAGAFAFWRDRGAQVVAIRVFTPQIQPDGWRAPLTVIESVLNDRPFVVDTLCAAIDAEGGELRSLLHPLLGVERRADGTVAEVGPPDIGTVRESFFHAEVAGVPATPALQQRLAERLHQVVRATDDYAAMRARLAATAAALRERPLAAEWDEERIETADFLDWLAAKSFVFLGYREYDLRDTASGRAGAVRHGRGLGVLRDDDSSSWHTPRALPPGLARAVDAPPLLLVSTTHAESPVHRRAPMDDFALQEIDASGRVTGIRRVLGLFTSKAYGESASEVPLLRRRLGAILAREGLVEASHDHRDRVELFDSFPREELFASRVDDLADAMHAVATADPAGGIQIVCRPDTLQRGLLTIVILSRARFSTELHAQVSAALRRHFGTILHEHLALDDRPVARLHYFSAVPPETLAQPLLDALRADLEALLHTWEDELRQALARLHGRNETERLASRYSRILPAAYRAGTAIGDAVTDIRCLETLLTTGSAQIELAPGRDGAPMQLKLYLADEALVLSEFVPVLENLGFRVLGQDVVDLRLPEARRAGIHTFTVEPLAVAPAGLDVVPLVVAALHAVRGAVVDNDRLNALVTGAGLEWRAVDLLRAYVEHARQIGVAARQTLVEALVAHPECTRRLFALFTAKFDPAASSLAAGDRAVGPVVEAHAQVLAGLDAVQSLAHDRALRAVAAAIAATLRTNFYAATPGAAVALKLDGAQIPHLPVPRPALETWVHAVGVQGVHLRAGRVARGGIRASDRPDDFRAEIVGLMQTQVVKNAVIVPVGAKGGFIVRGTQRGAPPEPARVADAYRTFIEALLSITDDLENGQPMPPAGQLVYDAPDPYLVVAADKGTASFSDLANEIAARRGFWLGDAFASGGSHGYDHKRLAITARGAWECARQHFGDLGRDLDRETVTVAGIGDMSGDVFGNGMLRSRHLRLLAAFDHRDIFVDPDPDAELAYAERERLFALPGSRWSDYAPAALSRGGGVYPRAAKTIPLSAEARALLALESAAPSGEEVVRAVLRLPVDLLWNGGIGTYVKASDEAHVEVADPANDAVRIDARELRAAVVAEGGNLGLTQRARIEYAVAGGCINTDAIDNSGGVDLSDHEVNLKIALQPLFTGGTLDAPARDALLAEIAGPVCDAVLANNRRQAMALGLDQERSRTHLAEFRDLTSILESEAGLDRQRAHLPTRETLRARRAVHLGLTRPELAVLLANTKLDLQRRLLQSTLCDDPVLESDLRGYCPGDFAVRLPDAVARHPLRREIIAVRLANQLVDRMGMTFLVRTVRDTGHDVIEVVRAWAAARALADADALASELDAARERLSGEGQRRAARLLADALDAATTRLADTQPAGAALAVTIERFRTAATQCLADWPALLDDERRAAHERTVAELAAAGLPPTLAERLARATAVADALEIGQIAASSDMPLDVAAHAYAGVGHLVDLAWLRGAIATVLAGEDRWEARAAAGLLAGLGSARRQLTRDVLSHRRPGTSTVEALDAYAVHHREQLETLVGLIADVKAASQPSLPALLVVMRELGRLARPSAGPDGG